MSWSLLPFMLQGCLYTLLISGVSIVLGLLLGTLVSSALMSGVAVLQRPARTFVSFFRGVPLLVQLLLIYNLLPALGLEVPGMVAAVVGLTLCTAAYQAENLRGGFASVPRGLVEAAEILGLSAWQRLYRIRAPIALRLTLPALVNEATMILKASSLVSVVGVVELTRVAQDLSASTFAPLPIFATAGAFYYLLSAGLSALGHWLERRMAWGQA